MDSGRQTGFEWSCKSWVVVSQLQKGRNHPSHPLSYWILPVLPGIIKAVVSSFKAAVRYHPGTFQQIRGHLRVCNIKHRLWSHPLYYFLVEADHLVWINCQVRLSYFSMSKIVPFHTKLEHTPKPVPTRYNFNFNGTKLLDVQASHSSIHQCASFVKKDTIVLAKATRIVVPVKRNWFLLWSELTYLTTLDSRVQCELAAVVRLSASFQVKPASTPNRWKWTMESVWMRQM